MFGLHVCRQLKLTDDNNSDLLNCPSLKHPEIKQEQCLSEWQKHTFIKRDQSNIKDQKSPRLRLRSRGTKTETCKLVLRPVVLKPTTLTALYPIRGQGNYGQVSHLATQVLLTMTIKGKTEHKQVISHNY